MLSMPACFIVTATVTDSADRNEKACDQPCFPLPIMEMLSCDVSGNVGQAVYKKGRYVNKLPTKVTCLVPEGILLILKPPYCFQAIHHPNIDKL